MNSHLSSEEMYQWLSGEGVEVEEHLRDCPACQAELHQLKNALAGFRNSLEECPVPPASWRPVRHNLPRWILATAASSLLVATQVYWSARQQRLADQAKADELLLERVQTGLSRSVPASMEPLLQLISKDDQTEDQ
jgi:predicted anti-sigma-YlaC factor YlaD